MADKMLTHHWNRKRAQRTNTLMRGEVSITAKGTRYHLVCPYNEHLVGTLKRIGGWWRPRSGIWSLPTSAREPLRSTLRAHFQASQLPEGWR